MAAAMKTLSSQMGARLTLLISIVVAGTRTAMAGSIQVQALCISEFSWMSNSQGVSPCFVAGTLLSECAGGSEYPSSHVPSCSDF